MSDSKIDDGGPAFPCLGDLEGYGKKTPVMFSNGSHGWQEVHQGLSLRDWFAGQALAAIMATGVNASANGDAADAYMYADAMLKARNAQ